MNPLLSRLQPYPFERLRRLTQDITPSPIYRPISLGIGEPKHPTPAFICDSLAAALKGLAVYPATQGELALRIACATWASQRYQIDLNPDNQVLPVNGSREALFALAQTIIDPSQHQDQGGPIVICPNPFYQIYEGAALLGGAQIAYANANPARNFAPDWASLPPAIWERAQLVYVCSPGNPTGAVMPLDEWHQLFELSDRYDFVIAADECYSEIYFGDEAPLGGLEAAQQLGRSDFKNLVMLTSLSKRSNVPGLRSGFVAGDAEILKKFLLYRTYHGSAMNPAVQQASIAAWNDEAHVVANRKLYREKFDIAIPMLRQAMEVDWPDAGFYLWAKVPAHICDGSDTVFTRKLLAQYNVTVLPGSFLARDAYGVNPGSGRVRLALVASIADCTEAAERIVSFIQSYLA